MKLTPRLHITLPVVAFAAAVFAPAAAHAQAQSLLSSNQVVVSRVENLSTNAILVSGINFDKFKVKPTVSVSGSGNSVSVLSSSYNAATKDITVLLPAEVAENPGSYRLMVSFGTGTAGTDVFEFTVGAVGPKGPKGDKGDKGDTGEQGPVGPQGIQGEVGPQGIQGVAGPVGPQGEQGAKGDTGAEGKQGVSGVAGPAGAVGPQGPAGAQGPAGPQGPVGPQGPAATVGNYPVFGNVNLARAAGVPVGSFWVQSNGQVYQMMP